MAAVGTATVTRAPKPLGHATYNVITIAWTSDASGAVSGHPFNVGVGPLWQVTFIPGTSGSQPTDAYDVTLIDANGVDLAAGKGANLSNAAAFIGVQSGPLSIVTGGTLDLVVANAGNAKSGTVVLVMSR